METLDSRTSARVLVVGGSRGLGLGVVEALVERKAEVSVVARDADRLAEVKRRLGVTVFAGDATDRDVAARVLREVRPSVVVITAGATPTMGPIDEQTWDAFDAVWSTDVKAALFWIQEAMRLPLGRGSRVMLTSSGAALNGSPGSGGYAGAKRMIWLMAQYANGVAAARDLGVRFQVLVPQQIIGDTDLGRAAAEAYARAKGVTTEAFLAAFGKPLSPRAFGEHVATIAGDEARASATAFGLKGDTGIVALDGG